MKRTNWLAAAAGILFFFPAASQGDAIARNENAMVLAESDSLAQEVLEKANEYRRLAALEWLGEELPPNIGPMMIYPRVSETEERGTTWCVDDPRRHYHSMWVRGRKEVVLGSLLHHEVTHAVLGTQMPEGVPAFLDEGIASRVDDEKRVEIRRRILEWMAKNGNWPSLPEIIEMKKISAHDQQAYAVAASVTEFLLTRGEKTTLLKFARSGKANGWDQALRMHYRIESVDALEQLWRAWAEQQSQKTNALTRVESNRVVR